MRRVSVVGAPGSGKTTLGRQLAAAMGVPFVELDSLFHQAGWQDLSRDEFRSRVTAATAAEAWVVDGNYEAVRDLVWERADTVLWLDLPRRVVMYRVVFRTIRRALTRQVLWNGNREPLANFYRWAPEHNIIRWAWVKYPHYVERYSRVMGQPPRPDLRFMRLASGPDARELVRRVADGER
jgi:adenylate kinase family enzyme